MLLDEQTLKLINTAVVKSGYRLKIVCEEQIELILKSDSYIVESNMHFPTDISLAWDSGKRKR